MRPSAADRSVRAGEGFLEVRHVAGRSAVTAAGATSPLKLLTPRARGQSVWAYLSSFGGGLVAGDETRLRLQLGDSTRCFLSTQSSTKVYRNPTGRPCSQHLHATLGRESILVYAPDPVQAFANASYEQRQEFHLAAGSGLALVDWCTAGRTARGERWAFRRFTSRNEVFVENVPVVVDALNLSNETQGSASRQMGRFNAIALLLLLGPPMREAAQALLADIHERPVEPRAPLICSASPVGDGALLRVAGEHLEVITAQLRRFLQPLSLWLGDDPLTRKW